MATEGIVLPPRPSNAEDTQFEPIVTHDAVREGSTNVRRMSTHRSQQSQMERTLSRTASKPTREDPNLDINLPYRTLTANANLGEYTDEVPKGEAETGIGADGVPYTVVAFVPDDKDNPKNWSKAYRWWVTMVVAMTCFVVAVCSSVITPDIHGVADHFHVSETAAILTITVFVVGFGVGPMAFAPLSEIFGRQIIYTSTMLLAVIFVIPCAVAQNFGTLLVCRAIDGIAFSAPMTLVGGTLADCWRTEERGVPMAAFSAAPFIGPAIGPLFGGYLSDAKGWRWLYWIQLILSGFIWLVITFTIPETYAPEILKRRARKLSKETGRKYITEQDLDLRPFSERIVEFLLRPFQLLFTELIVFLMSVYMSILYGILYMFLVAYPIIYGEGKGWSDGKTGLMFIPLACGVLLSAFCAPLINMNYMHMVRKHNGNPPPEVRLIPMMVSCWFIPIGLFIFGWSSYPNISWAGPAFGGFSVGFGFIFLYNSANNYIVDSYQHEAASGLAAKTFLRSLWGAGAVVFTNQMYAHLGYQWASSLLAFLALGCCLIPFVFWFYGARIRARAKFAYSPDLAAAHDEEKA